MTMLECTSLTDPTCSVAGVLNVLSGSAILFGLGGSIWNPDTYQVQGYVNSERNIQSAKIVKRLFDTSMNGGKYTGYAAMTTNFFNSLCGAARATPLALGYVVRTHRISSHVAQSLILLGNVPIHMRSVRPTSLSLPSGLR